MKANRSPLRSPGRPLFGRERERQALDALLDGARDGQGGVLVVDGDPGVGKTALLDETTDGADDFRVVRTAGVEAEMELPFAALLVLCTPVLELAQRLTAPQREALEVSFGITPGPAPGPLLVGLAVLGLMAESAEERPLLAVVDDAHWLDRASARVLGFVARRLLAERIALVFATRTVDLEFARFPGLHVAPLGYRDSRALLESVLAPRVDEPVLERIVVETGGNPLALLELPRGLTPAQLAGGFGLPDAVPLAVSMQQSFARRFAKLPADARRLLLVAAADPVGEPGLLWRAAEALGIPRSAAEILESEDLLVLTPRVAFRHPLVRSAVYDVAERRSRREVHRALAEATDPDADPDRRAWHRAQAASTPDEDVAAELETSAERAQARGGFAAAAAFLKRSSELSLDSRRRAGRALAAAEAQQQAGSLDAALDLVAVAQAGPLDEFQRARIDVLRARISFGADRGSDAPPLFLAAARRLQPLDAELAREAYLDALTAAVFTGRHGGAGVTRQIAIAARAAPPSTTPPRAAERLLEGLATVISDDRTGGTPIIRDALNAFRSDGLATEEGLRWLWLAGRAAAYIWDYENWDALTAAQVKLSRASGALTVLPLTLSTRAGVELFAGNLAAAAALVEEVAAVADATDTRGSLYAAVALAAFRGREPDGIALIGMATRDFVARGEGMGVTLGQWATAMLNNGLGRYEEALDAAEQALEDPSELWYSTWTSVEMVEAAARTGRRGQATDALELVVESTAASGTPWALGIQARSRALLSDDESHYTEAIEHLQPTRLRADLARAQLLYGEWLRRRRRRIDARGQLRAAHDQFSQFGMEAFAERARVELEATGERARKRTVDTIDQLTPQELQVARLAVAGHTNREIAAQLFISPSTVEYHLRKAFRKLNVRSRTQLASRLQQRDV